MKFTLITLISLCAALPTKTNGWYLINVINNCPQPIWPALGQNPDSPWSVPYSDSGFKLSRGESRMLAISNSWFSGRMWGRTGCDASGSNCAVGDCGGVGCTSNSGVPGVSLAEFSYSKEMDKTFYNLSLVSGFNLGMSVAPSMGECETYKCGSADCSENQAYKAGSLANPCMGCSLGSGYTVTFCPA